MAGSVTNDSPVVSVVMGVHNGAAELEKTVDAVLRQSFVDLEFIIVNDGSTDDTEVILRDYESRDHRVVVIHQENQGLTGALISGSGRVTGQFLARQDIGDLSHRDRFEKQIEFLNTHRDVVAVSTGYRRIGPEGEYLGRQTREMSPKAVTDALIRQGIGLPHTAAMIRTDAFHRVGGYRAAFRYAQDSDLWYRLAEIGLLAEIPACLFDWGIDVGGISASNREKQSLLAGLARKCYDVRQLGGSESELLEQANKISWSKQATDDVALKTDPTAAAEFFIGSQLYSLGDSRCRRYLRRALARHPFWPRAWAKWALSFLKASNLKASNAPEIQS
ncbi:MAG: glycosyltransferase family 2 protein [Planctomycetota bacterium]